RAEDEQINHLRPTGISEAGNHTMLEVMVSEIARKESGRSNQGAHHRDKVRILSAAFDEADPKPTKDRAQSVQAAMDTGKIVSGHARYFSSRRCLASRIKA